MPQAVMEKPHVKKKKHWTYEDYFALDDGNRYEVFEGELIMTPAPRTFHQRLSHRLDNLLSTFVQNNKLGVVFYSPTDVVFGEDIVLQPDLLFILKERLDIIGEKAILEAPDLVIEILSESTAQIDTVRKKRIYAEYGVREYWIVDPDDHSIEVFENKDGHFFSFSYAHQKGKVQSKILDGFTVEIEHFFKPISK